MKGLISSSIFALLFTFYVSGQDTLSQDEQIFISHHPKLPQFPGGEDSLHLFIRENLRWPSPDFCGEGISVVAAIVETDGTMNQIEIKRSLCKDCDIEVLRLLKLMPLWLPPLENGKPIRTRILLPIRFKLE